MRKQIFRGFRDFRRISLTYILWDLVLYDYAVNHMKFRITCFGMIEPLPCVLLFFPMFFLVSTQKTEATFQILQLNPYFDYDVRKNATIFSAMKSL